MSFTSFLASGPANISAIWSPIKKPIAGIPNLKSFEPSKPVKKPPPSMLIPLSFPRALFPKPKPLLPASTNAPPADFAYPPAVLKVPPITEAFFASRRSS